MSARLDPTLAERVSALLAPLEAGAVGDGAAARPAHADVHVVAPERLPAPARALLVHDDGLTPTLERHLGCRLALRVLAERRVGAELFRHVQLVDAGAGRLASFGAIHLVLDRFAADARARILDGRVPLGTILREHAVAHARRVSGFFEIEGARLPHARLQANGAAPLHGRHSVLVSPAGELMAEVVEVLPPPAAPRSRHPA